MADMLLEMKDITKRFINVTALNKVNLKVANGEIHAVVGENGAGKSTLMNVLSGVYPYGTYEGDIVFDGKVCQFQTIKDSEKKGIVIIHQELALVPLLSIAENMFLGNERGTKARIDWDETYKKCAESLALVGLNENPHTLIKDIGVGKQQLVEIAKALAKDVRLLILDEPTASLNDTEAKKLLDLLLKLKKEKGVTSIIISHKLNEVSYVADSITVIRDGTTITSMKKGTEAIDENEIIKAMVGRSLENRFPKRENKNIGDVCFEVKDWCVEHPVFDGITVCDHVNFNIRKGEVVVILGPSGCGKSTLLRCINALEDTQGGEMLIDGEPIVKGGKNMRKVGMVFQSYDLFPHLNVLANITLAPVKVMKRDKEQVQEEARELLRRVGLSDKEKSYPRELSGGQKQRVAIVRALIMQPELLLFDEVTAALDPEMVREVLEVVLDLAKQGKTMMIVTHEMQFARAIADRIIMIDGGRIVEENTPERFFTDPETDRARQFLNTFTYENVHKKEQ